MSERDALIRAILANPAEDTPRLVLADWLDENDQDGTPLRIMGFLSISRGPFAGDPARLWWHPKGPTNSVPLGYISPQPFCVGDKSHIYNQGRSAKADGYYFGEWRCLQCAAQFASRKRTGIWEWIATRSA